VRRFCQTVRSRTEIAARRCRSRPENLTILVEAVQAGWIGRKPHTVVSFQAEFSDAASRQHPEFAGVDIEEGVAAQMLGVRYGPGPAGLSNLADS